jgi:hypothetical protein
MIIPSDVFKALCIELERMSHAGLECAKALFKLSGRMREEEMFVMADSLRDLQDHIGRQSEIFGTILEENHGDKPTPS